MASGRDAAAQACGASLAGSGWSANSIKKPRRLQGCKSAGPEQRRGQMLPVVSRRTVDDTNDDAEYGAATLPSGFPQTKSRFSANASLMIARFSRLSSIDCSIPNPFSSHSRGEPDVAESQVLSESSSPARRFRQSEIRLTSAPLPTGIPRAPRCAARTACHRFSKGYRNA